MLLPERDLNKYDDLYRSSDHEPAIVILDVLADADQPAPLVDGTTSNDKDEEWYGGSTGLVSFVFLTAFVLFRRFGLRAA